jgi:hypothetical protein
MDDKLQPKLDEATIIPISDTVVLCNGCNGNIYSDDRVMCPTHGEQKLWYYRILENYNPIRVCNTCHQDLLPIETFGYLIYLGKRELAKDQPYDFYCEDCTKHSFPKAIDVTNGIPGSK